jgi:hypothetical protein
MLEGTARPGSRGKATRLRPDRSSEAVRVTRAQSLKTMAAVTGASTTAGAAPEADANNTQRASMG